MFDPPDAGLAPETHGTAGFAVHVGPDTLEFGDGEWMDAVMRKVAPD